MNLAEANRILRLSDSQLALVRQAAVPLSPTKEAATDMFSLPPPRHISTLIRTRSLPQSRRGRAGAGRARR